MSGCSGGEGHQALPIGSSSSSSSSSEPVPPPRFSPLHSPALPHSLSREPSAPAPRAKEPKQPNEADHAQPALSPPSANHPLPSSEPSPCASAASAAFATPSDGSTPQSARLPAEEMEFGDTDSRDLILMAGGDNGVRECHFHVHLAVLTSNVPWFRDAFNAGMREMATSKFHFPEDHPESWKILLRRFYPPHLKLAESITEETDPEHIRGLLVLVDKYDIQWIRSELLDILRTEWSVRTFGVADDLARRQHLDIVREWFQGDLRWITAATLQDFLNKSTELEVVRLAGLASFRLLSSAMPAARIADVGAIYQSINTTDRLVFPSVFADSTEAVKQKAGCSGWVRWYPRKGDVGIIVHQFDEPPAYLMKVGDNYVVIGKNGVTMEGRNLNTILQ